MTCPFQGIDKTVTYELVKEIKAYEKDTDKREELREKWIKARVRPDDVYVDKILMTDPLWKQIRYLYNKYEFPKRHAKRKIINEKLSKNYRDGKVGRTDDYTGIETEQLNC